MDATKRCPVCDLDAPETGVDFCPRCGWKFKRSFSEWTEEEKTAHMNKLALAVRDGAARRAASRRNIASDPVREEHFPDVLLPASELNDKCPGEEKASEELKSSVTVMEFVFVEGGCGFMGSGDAYGERYPHERPVHEICVDGFRIGKYPVTQGEWKAVMGNNPSHFKLGDRYPVECVSWLDAEQFVKRLNAMDDGPWVYRLPTEAEWEYACRGGANGCTREQEDCGSRDDPAWHDRNSDGSTHPVGEKKPNALGLYDMTGNVWEWCRDIYSDTAYANHERVNPVCGSGEPDRVLRGGSWNSEADDARCAARGFLDETYRRHYIGFRLVRIDDESFRKTDHKP